MARRSLTGTGRICGIYTLGTEDPYAAVHAEAPRAGLPILTASIGEDFADCRWPLTVKAQGTVTKDQLIWYLNRLYEAVDEGFYMDPGIGPAIYWRWSGAILPGMAPEDADAVSEDEVRDQLADSLRTAERSYPGHGPRVGIYLVDEALNWAGDHFYGKIVGDVAISGSVDEDYAASQWPVVAKIHAGTKRSRFCDYLQRLMECIGGGFFFEVTELLH